MDISLAIIIFIFGFLLVNGLKYLHIIRKGRKLHSDLPEWQSAENDILKTAYFKSLPLIPIYYLIVWIVCAVLYFTFHHSINIYVDALLTGVSWWLASLLLEMLLWVRMKHKLQLSWKEMYMKSQPWLSISYYAILISPLIISLMS